MSSWVSHLPEDIKYSLVVGHGMNAQEVSTCMYMLTCVKGNNPMLTMLLLQPSLGHTRAPFSA